ncbi:MAG: TusE/DsrC/DsvC family sulfur relay protein [Planctomycetota bacterium]
MPRTVTTSPDQTNNEEFMTELVGWTREVAQELARRSDLGPLTPDHWAILNFVRTYYLAHGEGPPIARIGRATGLSARRICELFPCGVVKGAYRIAGLPRPTGCF